MAVALVGTFSQFVRLFLLTAVQSLEVVGILVVCPRTFYLGGYLLFHDVAVGLVLGHLRVGKGVLIERGEQ